MSGTEIPEIIGRLTNMGLDEKSLDVDPRVLDMVEETLPQELPIEIRRKLAPELVGVFEEDVGCKMCDLDAGVYYPGPPSGGYKPFDREEYLQHRLNIAAIITLDSEERRILDTLREGESLGKITEEIKEEKVKEREAAEIVARATKYQSEIELQGVQSIDFQEVRVKTTYEEFTIPLSEYQRCLALAKIETQKRYCACCGREARAEKTAKQTFVPQCIDGYQFCFDCINLRGRVYEEGMSLGKTVAAMHLTAEAKQRSMAARTSFDSSPDPRPLREAERKIKALPNDLGIEEFPKRQSVNVEAREPIPGGESCKLRTLRFTFNTLGIKPESSEDLVGKH